MPRLIGTAAAAAAFLGAHVARGCSRAVPEASSRPARSVTQPAQERQLVNIRQLTSGGENAEAYCSPDGTRLIFQ